MMHVLLWNSNNEFTVTFKTDWYLRFLHTYCNFIPHYKLLLRHFASLQTNESRQCAERELFRVRSLCLSRLSIHLQVHTATQKTNIDKEITLNLWRWKTQRRHKRFHVILSITYIDLMYDVMYVARGCWRVLVLITFVIVLLLFRVRHLFLSSKWCLVRSSFVCQQISHDLLYFSTYFCVWKCFVG